MAALGKCLTVLSIAMSGQPYDERYLCYVGQNATAEAKGYRSPVEGRKLAALCLAQYQFYMGL